MKKRLLKIAILACTLVMILALIGCGPKENGEGEKTLRVGYLPRMMSLQWCQDVDAELRELAKQDNAEIITMDCQRDPAEQLQLLDTMIAQQLDGIVIFLADEKISETVVERCAEAGIPVIGESLRMVDEEGNYIAPCVELEGEGMGRICAEWLAQYLEDNGIKAPYEDVGFINLDDPETKPIHDRANGAEETFFKLLPDFPKERYYRVGLGKEGGAVAGFNAAAATIAANPTIKKWLVVAPNDDQGGGAVRALEQAGLDKDACVVSMGAESARYEWADKGSDTCWKAASFFSAYDCVSIVWEGMMEILKEGKDPKEIYAEHKKPGQEYALVYFTGRMVTPDNYKELMGKYAE
jgi:L-arabinose transport system substrate-binding protein